jgi:hypothetical protein
MLEVCIFLSMLTLNISFLCNDNDFVSYGISLSFYWHFNMMYVTNNSIIHPVGGSVISDFVSGVWDSRGRISTLLTSSTALISRRAVRHIQILLMN